MFKLPVNILCDSDFIGTAHAQKVSRKLFTQQVINSPEVKSAFEYIDAHKQDQIAEWIKITEIPSPSTMEEQPKHLHNEWMKKAGVD